MAGVWCAVAVHTGELSSRCSVVWCNVLTRGVICNVALLSLQAYFSHIIMQIKLYVHIKITIIIKLDSETLIFDDIILLFNTHRTPPHLVVVQVWVRAV